MEKITIIARGKVGSGKTTCLNIIRKALEAKNFSCAGLVSNSTDVEYLEVSNLGEPSEPSEPAKAPKIILTGTPKEEESDD